jgi:hypothetical protein
VTRSHQLRRIGWLLTPLVVWAASFLGAWGGAALAARTNMRHLGLELMVGGAIAAAAAAAAIWVASLRRGLRSGGEPETRE